MWDIVKTVDDIYDKIRQINSKIKLTCMIKESKNEKENEEPEIKNIIISDKNYENASDNKSCRISDGSYKRILGKNK